MNPWVRRIGMTVGAVVGVFLLAFGAVYAVSGSRLAVQHDTTAHSFDPASGDVVEGMHLAGAYGCMDCHGENLGGTLLIDGMPFARIAAPNLTSGRALGPLTDAQWELAVRHGIGTAGQALAIMPSPEYVYLSDSDLADIVAYMRTLPSVSDELPARAFGPVGRTLITLGKLPFAPDLIAPDADHMPAQVKEPTAEFGFYLTRLCIGCHGHNLAGLPATQPGSPDGANLTPAGNLANWSWDQFAQAMRTGRTPEGKELDPNFMPWTALGRTTDTELRAIWEFLTSLDPIPSAGS